MPGGVLVIVFIAWTEMDMPSDNLYSTVRADILPSDNLYSSVKGQSFE